MNRIKYILSFLILAVITFLFLHSELDLFTPEQHIHSAHDFCDIVDKVELRGSNLSKLKTFNFDLQIAFLFVPVNILIETQAFNFYEPQKYSPDTGLRILYSSFLI